MTAEPLELGPFPDSPGYDEALALDRSDGLGPYRDRFHQIEPGLIYLDGNSIGRMPIDEGSVVDRVTDHEWAERLIRSWNEGWWDLHLRLGDLMAPLVGASAGEVMISDSTSVNLFKLAGAAVASRSARSRIITDDLNFPSDIYVLDGIASSAGMELVVVESDGVHGPVERLSEEIDERTALVSLSHTSYMSGYTYEMAEVNRMTHDAGALVLWDTSHSVGAMTIDFEGSGTDLAVGCTYKYMNGGPGSPAFLYVRRSLQESLENPITAWWAHAAPFDMSLEFEPTSGIRRFHTGTMPILSLAAIEPGIDMILEAGITAIREKSIALTEYFVSQYEEHLTDQGFGLASPAEASSRGSHVALAHPLGWEVTRALVEVGRVIPDFRAPETIRFGMAPLYTTFLEVHTAVVRLRRLMEHGVHLEMDAARSTVT